VYREGDGDALLLEGPEVDGGLALLHEAFGIPRHGDREEHVVVDEVPEGGLHLDPVLGTRLSRVRERDLHDVQCQGTGTDEHQDEGKAHVVTAAIPGRCGSPSRCAPS